MINFIVNSQSGKRQGKIALNTCTNICAKKGLTYSVHFTKYVAHAEEIAKELSAQGHKLIVTIGGDGTFHEVLNGIDPAVSTMGFVPAGRGNDFALACGFSKDPSVAFNNILKYDEKNIDYIQVNDRRCLNVAGTGMDVDVLKAVLNKGGLSYYTSLISCLVKFKPYYCRIKVNGEVIDRKCIMVGVCNGIAIGGGMKLSPESVIDDGKLNIIIMEKKEKALLGIVNKFKKGKHMNLPETTQILTDEIEILNYGLDEQDAFSDIQPKCDIQLDGEIYKDVPFKCKIMKGGLKIKGIK